MPIFTENPLLSRCAKFIQKPDEWFPTTVIGYMYTTLKVVLSSLIEFFLQK